MGKRKVTILYPAAITVAEIAFYIEGEGLPKTAKKFVDEAYAFFEKLSDNTLEHAPCRNRKWRASEYKCAIFRKKYMVAFISLTNEIVICDFVNMKLLR